jgi:hypothetical protein
MKTALAAPEDPRRIELLRKIAALLRAAGSLQRRHP